jgi:hypothetical protein
LTVENIKSGSSFVYASLREVSTVEHCPARDPARQEPPGGWIFRPEVGPQRRPVSFGLIKNQGKIPCKHLPKILNSSVFEARNQDRVSKKAPVSGGVKTTRFMIIGLLQTLVSYGSIKLTVKKSLK